MSSKQQLLKVQTALSAKGFAPGEIDGIWGRRTEAAVRRFQASAGLVVDGIVGPRTLSALLGEKPLTGFDNIGVPWFQEARRLLGIREGQGSTINPVIIDWARDAGIAYSDDEDPWCGLFVAHCIAYALPSETFPANLLGARNWLKFGSAVAPQLGAIMVFWRGKKSGWKGHVGLYAGEDADAYHILGGNQSDSVCVTRVLKDRLLGARWPVSVPIGTGQPIWIAATDGVSTNEA